MNSVLLNAMLIKKKKRGGVNSYVRMRVGSRNQVTFCTRERVRKRSIPEGSSTFLSFFRWKIFIIWQCVALVFWYACRRIDDVMYFQFHVEENGVTWDRGWLGHRAFKYDVFILKIKSFYYENGE